MLVITGGLVHSGSAARGEPHDIVVEGDVIADIVEPGAVRNANAEVIDASRRLIIPGLINAHTHSHGGLSQGRRRISGNSISSSIAAPWIGGSRSHEDKHLSALINSPSSMSRRASTACIRPVLRVSGSRGSRAWRRWRNAYAKVGLRAVIAPMVADLHLLPGGARPDQRTARRCRATAPASHAHWGRPTQPSLRLRRPRRRTGRTRATGLPARYRADHPAPLHPRIHDPRAATSAREA